MIQTNAYSAIAMKTKINRPSAKPAHVEAATVKGQATLVSRSWTFDNALTVIQAISDEIPASPKLPLLQLIADLARNFLLYGEVPEGNQGSEVRTVATPSDSPSPKSEQSKLPKAALRAILSRHNKRPAWFKGIEDGTPVTGDRIYWWVTQFTYEQMEGNREATIALCNAGLACPDSDITSSGNIVSSKESESAAVAELVEAAAQVVDDWGCVDESTFFRLRSALEVVKTDLAVSHNTDSTD